MLERGWLGLRPAPVTDVRCWTNRELSAMHPEFKV